VTVAKRSSFLLPAQRRPGGTSSSLEVDAR